MSGLLQRLFEENGGKVAAISWRPIHSLQGADHRRGPGAGGFARSNPVKFILLCGGRGKMPLSALRLTQGRADSSSDTTAPDIPAFEFRDCLRMIS
jgi:hypothetical protein